MADDKRRLEAFVRRGVRLKLHHQEPAIAQLVGQITVSSNTGRWKSCHPSSPPAVCVEQLEFVTKSKTPPKTVNNQAR